MRKLIIALTLSIALAGCANINGKSVFLPTASVANPVTSLSMYDIKATYAIAQAGAEVYIQRYRDGFRCTKTKLESVTNLCSRRSVVLRLQTADQRAQIALGKADAFISANPTIDASSVISAAQLAVSAFSEIQKGNP